MKKMQEIRQTSNPRRKANFGEPLHEETQVSGMNGGISGWAKLLRNPKIRRLWYQRGCGSKAELLFVARKYKRAKGQKKKYLGYIMGDEIRCLADDLRTVFGFGLHMGRVRAVVRACFIAGIKSDALEEVAVRHYRDKNYYAAGRIFEVIGVIFNDKNALHNARSCFAMDVRDEELRRSAIERVDHLIKFGPRHSKDVEG